jgi:hypothetical protein
LEEEKKIEYPFVFIDESGTSGSEDNIQPYFGVGFLKIKNPIEISKRLINIICNSKNKSTSKKKRVKKKNIERRCSRARARCTPDDIKTS